MAIRLEEYNKNQRVYNRNRDEETYSADGYNEKQQDRIYESSNNTTQYILNKKNNRIQFERESNSENPESEINNSQDINHSRHFLQKDENNNYSAADFNRYHSLKKSRSNIPKAKIFYCIITIIVFLFTPFLMTISLTGVIESNISDSLVEVRRVNLKYKNGSQAMDISKYMVGVLATRLSMSKEVEVLKAESIMIRTEIYRCMGDDMSIDSTDLNLNYISDKEMKSLWGDSFTDNYNLIVDCISATSGMLISYNSQLIEPMYHEVSCGKTRNGSQVFADSSVDYAYLTSTACDRDVESPNYLAVKTFTYDDFVKAFKQKYSDINISKENPSESLQIVSRCSADYVLKIQVGNVLITGEEFANALELNSSCLWIDSSNNSIKITTKGKGNGLGVSIYTADYMAKNGSTYQDILNKFYANISIMSE